MLEPLTRHYRTGAASLFLILLVSGSNTFYPSTFQNILIALGLDFPARADSLPTANSGIQYTPPNRGAPTQTAAGGVRAYEGPRISSEENLGVPYEPSGSGSRIYRGDYSNPGYDYPSGYEFPRHRVNPPVLTNPNPPAFPSAPFNPKECSPPLPIFLVPQNHLGQTLSGYPSFFWYATKPNLGTVEFALKKVGERQPFFVQSRQILKAGIFEIALPKTLPELIAGQEYLWSISVVCQINQQPKKVLIEAGVKRVLASPSLSQELADVNTESDSLRDPPWRNRASIYAREGYWYDALSALATASQVEPQNPLLLKDFLSLLEQVGLTSVANQESQQAQNLTINR